MNATSPSVRCPQCDTPVEINFPAFLKGETIACPMCNLVLYPAGHEKSAGDDAQRLFLAMKSMQGKQK